MGGFLLGAIKGAWLGLAVFGIVVLGSYSAADKVFLALTHSRKLPHRDPFLERVKNISFCMGLSPINVFISKKLPDNIYVLDSLFGGPSLLITEGIQSQLENESLEFLVREALRRVSLGTVLHSLVYSFIFAFMELPFQFLVRWKWTYYLGVVYGFFLIPVGILKSYIIQCDSPNIEDFNGHFKRIESLSYLPLSRQIPLAGPVILEIAKDIGTLHFSRNSLWSYVMGHGLDRVGGPKAQAPLVKHRWET